MIVRENINENKFDDKLKELVDEFNSMGLYAPSMLRADVKIRAKGEVHYHDYYICLNVRAVTSDNLEDITRYVSKYKGKLGIHPVQNNDTLAIRIDDRQFDIEESGVTGMNL